MKTTDKVLGKLRRCRCVSFRRADGDEPASDYRCPRKTRNASGVCNQCRPIGTRLYSKRGEGRCGPQRRLAPL